MKDQRLDPAVPDGATGSQTLSRRYPGGIYIYIYIIS